jgi:hypothetical protein
MKMKPYFVISVLVGCFFISGLAPASAQEEDLIPLLDKTAYRMSSYPENDNWKARIVTKNAEMDKEWQPTKTTITTMLVKSVDNVLSSVVLKAEEIEDGVTKDITQEVAEQTQEQIERSNERRIDQKSREETEESSNQLFPFDENKRAKFAFHRLDDTSINERPVFLIEAVAKEKEENLFEGKYYIDQETYDVLKAQIKPSKNPRFVKELDMDIDYEVLLEGNRIERKSRTRVNGGPFFKRVRMIIEVEYFDIEILDSNAI